MDMPIVAGMDIDKDRTSPPAMAGAVFGIGISVLLWAMIGMLLYLIV